MSSVIVLALAAAVFLITVYLIYSGNMMEGDTNIFSVYGGELVEFEKASVSEVLNEDMEIDEAADGAYEGSQELSVVVGSGRYKGEEMVVYIYVRTRPHILSSVLNRIYRAGNDQRTLIKHGNDHDDTADRSDIFSSDFRRAFAVSRKCTKMKKETEIPQSSVSAVPCLRS